MKVLVTGALGQIGSHVVELLLEQDIEVYGIDNLATGRQEHLSKNPRLNLSFESISNLIKWKKFLRSSSLMLLYIQLHHIRTLMTGITILTNCVGGSNIIQLSKKFNVKDLSIFKQHSAMD